ncbi:MAG: hypothetical protein QNI93_11725 [Kiloniellales bacterium]|nr:hypothetical protein [Kiloniellales bacterium]
MALRVEGGDQGPLHGHVHTGERAEVRRQEGEIGKQHLIDIDHQVQALGCTVKGESAAHAGNLLGFSDIE